MEIKAKAYIPFRLANDYDKVIVSHELTLRGKEIVKFQSLPDNHEDFGFKNVQRQEYSFKCLDADHKTFTYSNGYIEIVFSHDDKPCSVYIGSTYERRAKIKWAFKQYSIQKDGNFKWLIATIIALIAVVAKWKDIQSILGL